MAERPQPPARMASAKRPNGSDDSGDDSEETPRPQFPFPLPPADEVVKAMTASAAKKKARSERRSPRAAVREPARATRQKSEEKFFPFSAELKKTLNRAKRVHFFFLCVCFRSHDAQDSRRAP